MSKNTHHAKERPFMSTLTIELDSLTEDRLQQRSLQEGRKQEEIAAGLLALSLAVSPSAKVSEVQLLQKINQGWNEQEWNAITFS